MNTDTPPTIEPVTDDDVMVAVNLPARALEPHTRRILEQDRRRVAERQANHGTTHAEGCVSWGRGHYECAMVEIERLRAEVAALKAACAAMQERCAMACEDEARIWEADGKGPECAARLCAARIRSLPNVTDAGKGWIDATGAVEAVVSRFPAFSAAKIMVQQEVPDDWAGSRVLIVRVAK